MDSNSQIHHIIPLGVSHPLLEALGYNKEDPLNKIRLPSDGIGDSGLNGVKAARHTGSHPAYSNFLRTLDWIRVAINWWLVPVGNNTRRQDNANHK